MSEEKNCPFSLFKDNKVVVNGREFSGVAAIGITVLILLFLVSGTVGLINGLFVALILSLKLVCVLFGAALSPLGLLLIVAFAVFLPGVSDKAAFRAKVKARIKSFLSKIVPASPAEKKDEESKEHPLGRDAF